MGALKTFLLVLVKSLPLADLHPPPSRLRAVMPWYDLPGPESESGVGGPDDEYVPGGNRKATLSFGHEMNVVPPDSFHPQWFGLVSVSWGDG